ncbi:phage portal protein [Corynebacterium diphtheriae bv. mitis]|nr:phage portal protein [Corynebacterium diphtheriae bv. mitis]CAB0889450.1 phage portal protein [Corynebacterium diphtheriae]CAB0938857.1 phage portal protein [Corynebacterium diphtheriae]
MGMPEPKTTWPPRHLGKAFDQIKHDHALLVGDINLINENLAHDRPTPNNTPASTSWQLNGGIGGSLARAIYGKPRRTRGNTTIQRHLPFPARIADASAGLMVGEPPRITVHPDDEGNTVLVDALDHATSSDRFAADLYQAAVRSSGLGWVLARIVWDTTINEHPWIEWVDPDQAVITWAQGRPTEIIFWDRLTDLEGDKHVWRLLQLHKAGRVEYALYAGEAENIGHQRPYVDHPDAAYLVDIVDAEQGINTGTTHLTACVLPNREGVHRWRHYPQLKNLGASDISAAGGLFADLDKIWTDFMNEIDSAKSKLLISEELMEVGAPGSGLAFEFDRTIFPVAQGATADAKPTLEQVQFNIRVQEYVAALEKVQRQIMDAVGISPLTLGDDSGVSGAMTATEVKAKSKSTLDTWRIKARMWRAALSELMTAYLWIEAGIHGVQGPARPVNVAMREPVQETDLDRANAVQTLRGAQVMSIETAVERLHPEWTPQEKELEVQRIKAENAAVDPFTLGSDVVPPHAGDLSQ